MKKAFRSFCIHWPWFQLLCGAAVTIYLCLNWGTLTIMHRLALLNVVALYLHQFEEYVFPGGGSYAMNVGLRHSEIPDRYPLNTLSAMLVNVVTAMPVYALCCFLPEVTWLVALSMIANIGQLLMHGVIINIRLRRIYNPGLIAVVFLHMPLTIIFFCEIAQKQLMSGQDWLYALLAMVVGSAILIAAPQLLMARKDSSFRFPAPETYRFRA